MKRSIACLSVMLLAMTSFAATETPELPGYKLIFADEFDGQGLPNPEIWHYEEGFVRNEERQFYTARDVNTVCQDDGSLQIKGQLLSSAQRNPKFNPRAKLGAAFGQLRKEYDVISGSINTLGTFEFKYGKLIVRAKLPAGQGVWPAIWMKGANNASTPWPKCGEIDVMEYVWGTQNTVYSTCHWSKDELGNATSNGGKLAQESVSDGQWHLYEMDWTEKTIEFYFDKTLVHSFDIAKADLPDGENAFRKPFYLILNLALGGKWGGALDTSILPQTFAIDYVRVYSKDEQK